LTLIKTSQTLETPLICEYKSASRFKASQLYKSIQYEGVLISGSVAGSGFKPS